MREEGKRRRRGPARCGFALWSEKIDSAYILSERALPAEVVRISELRGLPRKVRSPVLAFEFL